MSSNNNSSSRGRSRATVVVAAVLGAVLVAIVIYRLTPKAGPGRPPAPPGAPGAARAVATADGVDLLPVLVTLGQPMPVWSGRRELSARLERDPFTARGALQTALATGRRHTTRDPAASDAELLKALHLKGIFSDTNGAAACINGRVLLVGEQIMGCTVREIGRWEVVLEKDGRRILLLLPIKRLVEDY